MVFTVVCAAAVTMQQCGKHVYAARNPGSAMEELLEAVFSAQSVPRGDQ
jgi:alkylhydroperoxidase/carboxymuconolactone decarboxylase family protein YurZ